MIIDHRVLWAAATNTWVVAASGSGPCVVIDAPPDPDGIGALLAKHDLWPEALLLTHGHIDHMGGAGGLARAHPTVTTWVHADDDFLTLHPAEQLRSLFGMVPPGSYDAPAAMSSLIDGMVVSAGGLDFEVVHTPGHTPGHCCFLLGSEGLLFSGDQLFAGSIGRFDLPGGDGGALFRSMRDRVMVLDDDVRVLPGHGPETTIGRERRTNPFRFEWR